MVAAESAATDTRRVDLATRSVRELNAELHAARAGRWTVLSPAGRHSIAAGVDAPLEIVIEGHVGYYCAGMNKDAHVHVRGSCGVGVAENMISGRVDIDGDASQSAGATAHGGLLTIAGNAAARCAISLKGADIVVRGSVGHMSAFMAQKGRLVICGDAGDALGDSLYEARLYVRGEVASLGADCIEKPMRDEHLAEVALLLQEAGLTDIGAAEFRRYGSARKLYTFDVDNADGS
jgi:methylamine---glutamate N-methyltransferase subunit B